MNKSNLKWLGRLGLIMGLVCVLDGLVVASVPRPMPWVGLISVLLPVLNVFLVAMPALNQFTQEKPDIIPGQED